MQNDASLPASKRRNYKHAVDGLLRMAREEGVSSFFRGVWPNSARGVLMTASQLASYDTFKSLLLSIKSLGLKDDLTTHFSASFLAGFVATTVCSPVDVIKTRVMSAKERQGIASLLVNIYRKEGVSWCFKGWLPVRKELLIAVYKLSVNADPPYNSPSSASGRIQLRHSCSSSNTRSFTGIISTTGTNCISKIILFGYLSASTLQHLDVSEGSTPHLSTSSYHAFILLRSVRRRATSQILDESNTEIGRKRRARYPGSALRLRDFCA